MPQAERLCCLIDFSISQAMVKQAMDRRVVITGIEAISCFGVGPGRLQAHPFRRQRGTDRQSHGHTQSNGQAQKGTANQRGHEEFSA